MLRILVAEDLQEDAQLLKLAFTRAGSKVPLHFVRDGAEAIDYLGGQGTFANREEHPLPSLLLLDIKMPGMDGFDVLAWLRGRPDSLRRLPVIVFSSSNEPGDINRAYDLGANSYLMKPAEFDSMQEAAHRLEAYWLQLNCWPECDQAAA